jgi:hypothetical protein
MFLLGKMYILSHLIKVVLSLQHKTDKKLRQLWQKKYLVHKLHR